MCLYRLYVEQYRLIQELCVGTGVVEVKVIAGVTDNADVMDVTDITGVTDIHAVRELRLATFLFFRVYCNLTDKSDTYTIYTSKFSQEPQF